MAYIYSRALVIAAINMAIVCFLSQSAESRMKNVRLLTVSTVTAGIAVLILSLLFDRNLLVEIDYKNEIDYFTILISSVLIDIWTIIFALLLKISAGFKHRLIAKNTADS